ncbi:MAG: hypothetical protein M1820_007492 [Bogoriella megaspora]|nr:MAG: hypothetical protein M1820_007492 [Bogoriella megaspora]
MATRFNFPVVIVFMTIASAAALLGIYSSPHLYETYQAFSQWTQPSERALIIASTLAQNVSWLDRVPTNWTVYRYVMDDTNMTSLNHLHPPRNEGREAMAYLTWIIEHYHNLPKYAVFTHGHEKAWHQPEPLWAKIRALNISALEEEDYISLRCPDRCGCEVRPYFEPLGKMQNRGDKGFAEFWREELFPDLPVPEAVSYKCCAQFAVTRRAILGRSREEWVRIRQPLMLGNGTDLFGDGKFNLTKLGLDVRSRSWQKGYWYEKTWHILFGKPAEYCPSPRTCYQNHFSNAIACDGNMDTIFTPGGLNTDWTNIRCATAFDNLTRDDPADTAIQNFTSNFVGYTLNLNRQREKERIEKEDRVDEQKLRVQQLEQILRDKEIKLPQMPILPKNRKPPPRLPAKMRTLIKTLTKTGEKGIDVEKVTSIVKESSSKTTPPSSSAVGSPSGAASGSISTSSLNPIPSPTPPSTLVTSRSSA